MNSLKPPRILLGLNEVAGYLQSLQVGFIALGIPCILVDLSNHRYQYAKHHGIRDPIIQFLQQTIAAIVKYANKGKFNRRIIQAMTLFPRLILLIWSMLRYDIFILSGNSSFLDYLELPLYRLFGKKVLYVFMGTDSRPPYINGIFYAIEANPDTKCCVMRSRERKKVITNIDRWAYAVINAIPQAHFHTRRVIAGLALGLPSSISYMGAKKEIQRDYSMVRILHAPSNIEAKGTLIIRSVIGDLKEQGLPIDYVEIIERPHDEVLDELQVCDFIVDELYSDSPLACFSTEAAFFAKPAVIGSYYTQQLYEDVPTEFIPPSLICQPDELVGAIRRLITDHAFREDLGMKAQRFVRERWDAKVVAQRYLRIIDNDIPPEWMFDPAKISYVYGYGLTKLKGKNMAKSIIQEYGKNALQLYDKPYLESLFIDMVCNTAIGPNTDDSPSTKIKTV